MPPFEGVVYSGRFWYSV